MDDTGIEEITDAELIRMFIAAHANDLHTALPARVESYDAGAQTVDVVPMVNKLVPDGATPPNYVSESLPKLADVPVAFPRGGGFFAAFPLQAGDFGMLVFCETNMGTWRATGNQSDPGDVGRHTMSSAFFIPAVAPDTKLLQHADATNLVIGSDTNGSSRIVIKPGGEIDAGAAATNFVAMAEKVKAWFDAFNAAVTGWTPVAMDGGAALKTALTTLVGGTPTTNVASTNLKAEG